MKVSVYAFVLLALTALPGADATRMIAIERLELQDGRKLSEVIVRSFDAESGKVLLVARNTAMAIPVDLLPAPLAEQVRTHAPKAGATFTLIPGPRDMEPAMPPPNPGGTPDPGEATVTPQPPEISNDDAGAGVPVRRIERPSLPGPTINSGAGAAADPAASSRALAAQSATHRTAALAHAERYFRFEFAAGSSSVRVTALDFDATDTRPVSGWPGRFRTEGKAYLEFFDSKGNSFGRDRRTFEVITEQPQGEPVRVERFELKR